VAEGGARRSQLRGIVGFLLVLDNDLVKRVAKKENCEFAPKCSRSEEGKSRKYGGHFHFLWSEKNRQTKAAAVRPTQTGIITKMELFTIIFVSQEEA
jgi:hypothetical protein